MMSGVGLGFDPGGRLAQRPQALGEGHSGNLRLPRHDLINPARCSLRAQGEATIASETTAT